MVHFFQQQPEVSGGSLIAQSIGQGLGSGIQQGMTAQLQGMLESKQNLNSAESIADQLKLRGDDRLSLIGTLSQIPAREQLGALAKLNEAQLYNSFLRSQQMQPMDQFGFGEMDQFQQPMQQSQMPITDALRSVNSMAPVNAMINAAMGIGGGTPQQPQQQQMGVGAPQPDQMQMAAQRAQATQPAAPRERTQKIGGFDMSQRDLNRIARQPQIPPFGFSAKAADIQDRNLKENRKEVAEYAEKYANMPELESNLKKLEEAKKLLGKKGFDVSNLRKSIIAMAEGRESGLAEIFKTPDQQKLFFLLKDSLKTKEVGGSNPSTREVLISMSAIPSYLKGKEANQYIINQMVKNAQENLERGKLISNLRRYNPSAEPAEFKSLVDEKMREKFAPTSSKIEMRAPDGKRYEVPANMIDQYKAAGWSQ